MKWSHDEQDIKQVFASDPWPCAPLSAGGDILLGYGYREEWGRQLNLPTGSGTLAWIPCLVGGSTPEKTDKVSAARATVVPYFGRHIGPPTREDFADTRIRPRRCCLLGNAIVPGAFDNTLGIISRHFGRGCSGCRCARGFLDIQKRNVFALSIAAFYTYQDSVTQTSKRAAPLYPSRPLSWLTKAITTFSPRPPLACSTENPSGNPSPSSATQSSYSPGPPGVNVTLIDPAPCFFACAVRRFQDANANYLSQRQ